MPPNQSRLDWWKYIILFLLGVDCLMFDTADVYKAQWSIFKKMEHILVQKMGDTR